MNQPGGVFNAQDRIQVQIGMPDTGVCNDDDGNTIYDCVLPAQPLPDATSYEFAISTYNDVGETGLSQNEVKVRFELPPPAFGFDADRTTQPSP